MSHIDELELKLKELEQRADEHGEEWNQDDWNEYLMEHGCTLNLLHQEGWY